MSIASFLTKIRKQSAIYWAKVGSDGYGGTTFAAPVSIACRWSDVAEKYMDENGVEKVGRSSIIVDRAMTVGGYLQLGTLDSATPASPIGVEGAYEIKYVSDTPDLKISAYYRKAIL